MCTNTWIKMVELLHKYSLIPSNILNKYFRSLHSCEAPGALICATNHKLRQLYDNSGNILNKGNICGLWKQAKAALVTTDGSVDTSSDPNEQGSIVSELRYAEAVTALGASEKGGALVLKM
ncbi:unnamed protein product [Didymodactylos carnosus]|uniref:Uncharacterized protein n=1 Tax=Didymodactylos carnosus TaxID=1234261 RepID=A0A815N859_9BILA|nr:unnamed protein product [Didymodactylos carnosus]CAF4308814.1 unnamed protein product [Didymodactylos carnosus]